jgi:hypothetical protein
MAHIGLLRMTIRFLAAEQDIVGFLQGLYILRAKGSVGYIFLQSRDFSIILFGLCSERFYNFTYPGG